MKRAVVVTATTDAGVVANNVHGAERIDRRITGLRVADTRSRWGSCAPDGRLTQVSGSLLAA